MILANTIQTFYFSSKIQYFRWFYSEKWLYLQDLRFCALNVMQTTFHDMWCERIAQLRFLKPICDLWWKTIILLLKMEMMLETCDLKDECDNRQCERDEDTSSKTHLSNMDSRMSMLARNVEFLIAFQRLKGCKIAWHNGDVRQLLSVFPGSQTSRARGKETLQRRRDWQSVAPLQFSNQLPTIWYQLYSIFRLHDASLWSFPHFSSDYHRTEGCRPSKSFAFATEMFWTPNENDNGHLGSHASILRAKTELSAAMQRRRRSWRR
jgi:hypothetical protein